MSRKVNATYTAEQVIGAFRTFEGNAPKGYIKVRGLLASSAMLWSARLLANRCNVANPSECSTGRSAAESVDDVWLHQAECGASP
eukprot:scaffold7624_cov248-Pinguiococcus_pyrenoidosus.AAC.20